MPDGTRYLFHGIACLLLLCPLALFLYFAGCADVAMDKTGLGDAVAWHAYQAKAGIAFWIAVCTWVLLLVVAALKQPFRSATITACAIVPIAGAAAWFAWIAA